MIAYNPPPLAPVGWARAAAQSGDAATARRAYQEFLAGWKDADPDVPVHVQARAEYAKLERAPTAAGTSRSGGAPPSKMVGAGPPV